MVPSCSSSSHRTVQSAVSLSRLHRAEIRVAAPAAHLEANGSLYFPARPARPAFCKASNTSLSLKSPVTMNDSAFLAAVLSFTPATEPSVSFTALTHLPQQRCTPSTLSDCTFFPFA